LTETAIDIGSVRAANKKLSEGAMRDMRFVEGRPGTGTGRKEPVRLLAGRKVLVVDDDTRNVFAICGVLEQHDVTALSAESGRDAVDLLKNNPDSDAVLMDIMMPGLDGYDTMRIIRAIPQFRDLPIIAITARAMHEDREKCLAAGASDYIAKPVDVNELLGMLESLLES
jgi:CheY-like chemotaxis protein